MYWDDRERGRWVSQSEVREDNVALEWVIEVTKEGKFSLSPSDWSLTPTQLVPMFDSLQAAKQFCEKRELQLLREA